MNDFSIGVVGFLVPSLSLHFLLGLTVTDVLVSTFTSKGIKVALTIC